MVMDPLEPHGTLLFLKHFELFLKHSNAYKTIEMVNYALGWLGTFLNTLQKFPAAACTPDYQPNLTCLLVSTENDRDR